MRYLCILYNTMEATGSGTCGINRHSHAAVLTSGKNRTHLPSLSRAIENSQTTGLVVCRHHQAGSHPRWRKYSASDSQAAPSGGLPRHGIVGLHPASECRTAGSGIRNSLIGRHRTAERRAR